MKIRKQKNPYDSTIIFDLDSSEYDAEILKILESGYTDSIHDAEITLRPQSYKKIHFTLIGNSICKKINNSFTSPEIINRNRKMRTALAGFRPLLRPTSLFYLMKKEYPSDINNKKYFRYSLIHSYVLLNKEYFYRLFQEIYGFKFNIYPHITLMVGTSDYNEPKGFNGIGLDISYYFKSNKVKKISQTEFFKI